MPVSNGWSGGQYSLFRALFGLYLCVHFAELVPWAAELFSSSGVLPEASASPLVYLFPNVLALYDAPWFVTALLTAGTILSILFALGLWDRAAAAGLWYLLACLFGRNPLIANPALPFVGWMLLAHAVLLPAAPYGSFAAFGRTDPGAGWQMPQPVYVAAWIVMAVAYSYSGYTKLASPSWMDGSALARVLDNPLARPTPLRETMLLLPPIFLRLATWGGLLLELSYAPLALVRRARPWIWTMMVLVHLGLLAMVDFADLTFGMLFLHFFTFDPAWIGPLRETAKTTVFYDGHCGLCHGFVRFLLAEDRAGQNIEFSPLEGQSFRSAVPEARRIGLPDSLVVHTDDGRLLVRSAAVEYIAAQLGGLWRLVAILAGLLPQGVLDACYNGVARIRRKLFRTPAEACPLLPPDLQARFRP
jgi:predicted DCC family thiol-disulfide oxidoreductase YuxK